MIIIRIFNSLRTVHAPIQNKESFYKLFRTSEVLNNQGGQPKTKEKFLHYSWFSWPIN